MLSTADAASHKIRGYLEPSFDESVDWDNFVHVHFLEGSLKGMKINVKLKWENKKKDFC